MTKKELKVEIPGKVYPRSFEWIKNKYKWHSFGRIRVPGGWLFREGLGLADEMGIHSGKCSTCTKKNTGFMFIPDPNHEWVLEPLKEEPEEETSEVIKELHKKADEAFEYIKVLGIVKELKRNSEKITKKTKKTWFSRLFRSNNG